MARSGEALEVSSDATDPAMVAGECPVSSKQLFRVRNDVKCESFCGSPTKTKTVSRFQKGYFWRLRFGIYKYSSVYFLHNV